MLPQEYDDLLNEFDDTLDIANLPIEFNNFNGPNEQESNILPNQSQPVQNNVHNFNTLKVKLSAIKWKKGNYCPHPQSLEHTNVELPNDIKNLKTPLDYFSYFFSEDLYEQIRHQTHLYCSQTNVNKLLHLTINDLKKYVGICIFTSVVQIPNVRRYWSNQIGF